METNVISKIKDFIITKLSVDERVALEGLNPVAAPAQLPVDEKKPSTDQTPEVKMKEAKTVDGLVFAYDGELVIGTAIMDITSGTASPVMDGEYTMEDGNIVTITSGVVSELVSKAEEATEPVEVVAPELNHPKEMDTKMSAMQVSLESQISSLKKQVVLLNKVVNEILNTPIQNETKVSKNWEELSPLEKFRLSK
jgi:flagellin-like hook-associated protein FlgL